ncbi:hypothetical protein BDR22DRAFT_895148 [Usnea florida]
MSCWGSIPYLPQDWKPSRLLVIYCVISTLFCFRLLYVAKLNAAVPPLDCPRPLASLALNASELSHPFPRKIWQTSKTGPAGLDGDDRKSIQSWVKINQKHRYEILTQYSAESYVKDRFSHRPDIEETFIDLQDPILRADLIRYLVLLGDGGVNLVVGIEYDKLDGGRWMDWSLDLQFCTWAILAKPGHLLMAMTVDRVIGRLKELARQQETTISGIRASFQEVMNTTGPALFTEAVIEGLAHSTGTNFTWHNLTGMTESRVVGDVLILPINAFGSGQGHSKSGSPDENTALVQHLFKGSWKADHPLNAEAEQPQQQSDAEQSKAESSEKSNEDVQ